MSLIIEDIMTTRLIDLGDRGASHFAGVMAPAAEAGQIAPGVTRQFLDDAENYHAKYFDIGYVRYQIQLALSIAKLSGPTELILDIGSGSGPSVFALIDQFPTAHVVATDISPNLLAILRRALTEVSKLDCCTTVCLDLNRPWFKGQPFDLAVGCAILHHLFEPDRLVEEVFTTIRPGGALIFFEPFEPGHAMVQVIYRTILAHANSVNRLPGVITDFFRGKIEQIAMMTCEPKDPVAYADVDDKWMFTGSYFDKLGQRIGARNALVYPINHSEQPFTNHIVTMLRLGLGLSPEAMPAWAWQLVAEIERSISDACKLDLILEGCVVFIK